MLVHRSFNISACCAFTNCDNEVTHFHLQKEPLFSRAKGQLRGDTNTNLCERHYMRFITSYTFFEKFCYSETHKKQITKGLRVISDEFAKKYNLIPGKKICVNCEKKIQKEWPLSTVSEDENVETSIEVEFCESNEKEDEVQHQTSFSSKFLGNNNLFIVL